MNMFIYNSQISPFNASDEGDAGLKIHSGQAELVARATECCRVVTV